MVLPNTEVVSSFYESYVNIRKDKWKLDENEPTQLLTSSKATQKVKICIELLDRFQKAKSFTDWVDIIYLCALKEHNEDLEKSGNLFFGLAKYFVDKPLLLLTIHASLAYIISQLSQNKEYGRLITKLETEKLDLEKAIAEDTTYETAKDIIDKKIAQLDEVKNKIFALSTAKNYHESYFQDIILVREPKALDLEEKTFADFERNILKGARPLSLCKKLLGYKANENKILPLENKVVEKKSEKNIDPQKEPEVIFPTPAKVDIQTNEKEIKPFENAPIKLSPLLKHSTFAKPRKEDNPYVDINNDQIRKYNLRRNH